MRPWQSPVVRIAALWWVALAAYPPTRSLLIYSTFPLGSTLGRDSGLANAAAAIAFLLHCLGAAWVVTSLVTRIESRSALSLLSWTLLIAWFAVASWLLVVFVSRALVSGNVGGLAQGLLGALFVLPLYAFVGLLRVTWIAFPLAAATVLLLWRWVPPPPRVDWLERPVEGQA